LRNVFSGDMFAEEEEEEDMFVDMLRDHLRRMLRDVI
jgi:hypothetical protein